MADIISSTNSSNLDADAGPLWFKPEKFLDPNFNPESYVGDLKRYVPLETLDAQLSAHAETLRARLVEVVNDDYDEFVSLSTKLVDVDGAVARLQAPLLEIKSRVEAARAAVEAQAKALQEGLARRQAAAAARALLELAQDAVHVMAKVEKLLAELPTQKPATSNDSGAILEAEQEELESRSRLLDRLCSEVSRLHFYAAKGEDLAVVRLMKPRIDRAAASLQSELDAALAAVLKAQNPTALAVLLHAYGSLGKSESAEAVVRKEVVAPVVGATVQKLRQVGPPSAAGIDGDNVSATPLTLAQVLPAIHAALKEQTGPFFELALSPAGGATSLDFLGGSVLPEVLSAVELACPGCYSPGRPDTFHANYVAATKFIDELEHLCVTATQVERFRASEAYIKHRKNWNLAAYFSLRFQDIAGALEDSLEDAKLNQVDQDATFKFVATAATWNALDSSIDAKIFLPQLADRFLKLALQIVARFCTWVADGLVMDDGGEKKEAEESQTRWGADASVEQLAALSQDISALQSALLSDLLPKFTALVHSQASEAIEAALSDCDARLSEASVSVLHAAAAGLVDRCCEALKQLRGIVATFRMTSRGAPTRPAQYASTILAPLSTFLASAPGLGAGGKEALVRAVVEGVVKKYRHLAHDTLSTVRKTESSLRRLKSRKQGGEAGVEGGAASGGGDALGTDDLIALQLKLDIEEFGKKVQECGVDPKGLESFLMLENVVVKEEAE